MALEEAEDALLTGLDCSDRPDAGDLPVGVVRWGSNWMKCDQFLRSAGRLRSSNVGLLQLRRLWTSTFRVDEDSGHEVRSFRVGRVSAHPSNTTEPRLCDVSFSSTARQVSSFLHLRWQLGQTVE